MRCALGFILLTRSVATQGGSTAWICERVKHSSLLTIGPLNIYVMFSKQNCENKGSCFIRSVRSYRLAKRGLAKESGDMN